MEKNLVVGEVVYDNRRFVKNFTKVALPMNRLTRKDEK